jgi:RNA polymerase sigma-70 factor, ECF subfamily
MVERAIRVGASSQVHFEAFFEAEQPRLLRTMYLMCGDRGEAEELTQEAFLRVWERWGRVAAVESPSGYLYATSYNLFRSRLRVVRRRAGLILRQPEPTQSLDARALVVDELRRLPPRQRAALVLTEYVGCSSEEAGGLMGIKSVTVRVLASQARSALRERLEEGE